jgi:hypothetical protein
LKDLKSVFEKFGLIEKVELETESKVGEANQKENEVRAEAMHEVKEVAADNVDNLRKADTGEDNLKLLRVDEIYKNSNIESEGINSLFIIESFLKALPDYLPIGVKRESVLNIISSSGMKLESLILDGNGKLKCLKGFSQAFSYEVKDTVSKYESEIRKLSERINNYERVISGMKNLQEEQSAVVEYETERINNILQFVASENK